MIFCALFCALLEQLNLISGAGFDISRRREQFGLILCAFCAQQRLMKYKIITEGTVESFLNRFAIFQFTMKVETSTINLWVRDQTRSHGMRRMECKVELLRVV